MCRYRFPRWPWSGGLRNKIWNQAVIFPACNFCCKNLPLATNIHGPVPQFLLILFIIIILFITLDLFTFSLSQIFSDLLGGPAPVSITLGSDDAESDDAGWISFATKPRESMA
jgi:hypothetical protein